MPSVSSPASSRSLLTPLIRIDNTFKALPKVSGSWMTLLPAASIAILCSKLLPAATSVEAERCKPLAIPSLEIAKLLPTIFSLSTISILLLASYPKACKLLINASVASLTLSNSDTFIKIAVFLASSPASSILSICYSFT